MILPNLLTLFRLALIPVYINVFFSDMLYRNTWAFLIVLIAGLSDIADGYIARRYGWTTQVGAMLDPLADKLMMLTVFLSMLLAGRISIYAAAAIFVRDLSMIIGSAIFHLRGMRNIQANALGKATTVLYYVAFVFLLFEWPYGQILLWGIIGFSFLTTFVYVTQIRLLNRKPVQR